MLDFLSWAPAEILARMGKVYFPFILHRSLPLSPFFGIPLESLPSLPYSPFPPAVFTMPFLLR